MPRRPCSARARSQSPRAGAPRVARSASRFRSRPRRPGNRGAVLRGTCTRRRGSRSSRAGLRRTRRRRRRRPGRSAVAISVAHGEEGVLCMPGLGFWTAVPTQASCPRARAAGVCSARSSGGACMQHLRCEIADPDDILRVCLLLSTQELRRATIDVLRERGWDGLTLARVAEVAGRARSTLWRQGLRRGRSSPRSSASSRTTSGRRCIRC